MTFVLQKWQKTAFASGAYITKLRQMSFRNSKKQD